jgi:hypothetical protein
LLKQHGWYRPRQPDTEILKSFFSLKEEAEEEQVSEPGDAATEPGRKPEGADEGRRDVRT